MGCLGVHFALSQEEVDCLRGFDDERDRLDYLQEEIEEAYLAGEQEFAAESDKAWDAMHRALADGGLTWEGGEYPLNHAVLGGEPLYADDDYIMSLKKPQQVREIAAALAPMTEQEFERRYFAINQKDYGFELSREDFQYTWEWFQNVRAFYLRASAAGRFVLFSADQ